MRGGFRAAKSSRLSAGLGVRISDACLFCVKVDNLSRPAGLFRCLAITPRPNHSTTKHSRCFETNSKRLGEEIFVKRTNKNSCDDEKLYDDPESKRGASKTVLDRSLKFPLYNETLTLAIPI